MELVSLQYRYINKLINSKELLKELKKIDISKYSSNEKNIVNQLIEDVKNIINNIPNEIDEIETKRLLNIEFMLEALGNVKKDKNVDSETSKKVNSSYKRLLKDKKVTKDGGKLYAEIFNLITKNTLICEYAKKMSDKELLDFITTYISLPITPVISQEYFDDLVKVGIKEDNREALWRLAFNYNNKNKDFSLIENYFIEKRDGYYLIELISAVKEDLNVDGIIKKVLTTKDIKFMNDCSIRAKKLGIITEEEIEKIREEYNKINDI